MLIDNKLNWIHTCVIDTHKFLSLLSETISQFINIAERIHGAEEERDDHIQPPGLINKQQTHVSVLGELFYHGHGLWRAPAYKAITSGAHYLPRSVVISPYDKPGQLLWAGDHYIPSTRTLELSLLVCGPC